MRINLITLQKLGSDFDRMVKPGFLRCGRVMMDVQLVPVTLLLTCLLSPTSLPLTSCLSQKILGNDNLPRPRPHGANRSEFPWMILDVNTSRPNFSTRESLDRESPLPNPSGSETFGSEKHLIKDLPKVHQSQPSPHQRIRNGREVSVFQVPFPTDTHHPTRHERLSPTAQQESNSITHEHPTRHSHHLLSLGEQMALPTQEAEHAQGRSLAFDGSTNPEPPDPGSPIRKDEEQRVQSKQEREVGPELSKSELARVQAERRNDISDVFNYNELMRSNGGDVRTMRACRLKTYLPEFLFQVHSCAACYKYQRDVPGMFGSPSRKWKTRIKTWKSPVDGEIHEIMVLANLDRNSTVLVREGQLLQVVFRYNKHGESAGESRRDKKVS